MKTLTSNITTCMACGIRGGNVAAIGGMNMSTVGMNVGGNIIMTVNVNNVTREREN